jgi:replication factor A1
VSKPENSGNNSGRLSEFEKLSDELSDNEIEQLRSKFESLGTLQGASFNEFVMKYCEVKEHFGNLIEQETAFRLTAYSFGYMPLSKISELEKESGKVMLRGKVAGIEQVRAYSTKDGEGLLAKVVLEDETGSIIATLWNEAAELVRTGEIFEGCNIEVKGFVRRWGERLEVSVNDPLDVVILEMGSTEIEGILVGLDKRESILRFGVIDEKEGRIKVIGCRAKEFDLNPEFGQRIYLKIDSDILMEFKTEEGKKEAVEMYFDTISGIKEGKKVNILGRVSGIGTLKVLRKENRTIKLSDIYVSDKTGRIRVLLWGRKAELLKRADVGVKAVVINGRVRRGEIHCDRSSIVNLL